MKINTILIVFFFFLITGVETTAQSEKKLINKTFTPYQWEIYNTIYKRRYWDFRDNYDYIEFDPKYTFKRRYQGTQTSGTWKYDKKTKIIQLKITKPFKKDISLRVIKLSKKELTYTSSEEDYKVKMFMKEGEVPKKGKRPTTKKKQAKATKPNTKKKD